jgi:hypothetical protein
MNSSPITEKQQAFILRLLDERDLSAVPDSERHPRYTDTIDTLKATVPMLSKQEASEWISSLLKFPEMKSSASKVPATPEDNYGIPSQDKLPTGRYAIDSADGELTFYRVWRGTKRPDYVKLYVLHGPDETEIPFGKGMVTILQAIAQDAGAAAIRYGHEIGHCSQCNLRLTNRVSRALGIGPICGGRFYADEWKSVVHGARESIKAQGLDPDENVEEDEVVVRYDVQSDFSPPTEVEETLRDAMPNASDNQTWTTIKDASRTMSDAELDSVIALLTREQEKREFAKREAAQERAAYRRQAWDRSFMER